MNGYSFGLLCFIAGFGSCAFIIWVFDIIETRNDRSEP